MNKYQQEFISNIKRFRNERKMSQAEFAELCNVSTGTIGNIECGLSKPSFDLLLKMADVFGVHPSTLLSEKENPSLNFNVSEEHSTLIKIYRMLDKLFSS